MKVTDVMTPGVAPVHADTPLREAARRMVQRRIGGVPVTNEAGELIGIISVADLMGRVTGLEPASAGEPPALGAEAVSAAMTERVVTIGPDASLTEAAREMAQYDVDGLPVVDEEGRVLGMLTRSDLVSALMPQAEDDEAPSESVAAGVERVILPDTGWLARQRAAFVVGHLGGARATARLLGVAPSQPSRWAAGKSVPTGAHARIIADLDHVLAVALQVWDEAVVSDWLSTANNHLDGARPIDVVRQRGSGEVVDALRAEAAGAYA